LAAAALAFLAGSAAALYYSHLGLALSHYDARAHLVVSRRIFDSIVPGWQQIGAVWLPLPHILDMLPVQLDVFYRTGAFAIAISVASMSVAAWAVARLVLRTTGSAAGGLTAAALFVANPNLLYLQSTPMTEPLLFATTMVAVMSVAEWVDSDAPRWPHAAGLALTAASMTRYEAWRVSVAIIALAGIVMLRRGQRLSAAVAACGRLTLYPGIAVVLFVLNSRWTTGHWFVTSGFFVAENEAKGSWSSPGASENRNLSVLRARADLAATFPHSSSPLRAIDNRGSVSSWAGCVRALAPALRISTGIRCESTGAAGLCIVRVVRRRRRPVASAHPCSRRCRARGGDPVQRFADRRSSAHGARGAARQRQPRGPHGRDGVSRSTLRLEWEQRRHGEHGFARALHPVSSALLHPEFPRGKVYLWVFAVEQGPHGFADWILVEEKAEGGDALFHRAQELPQFYRGFERVAEGGGVALYRATPERNR
jgi:hypothetical protein